MCRTTQEPNFDNIAHYIAVDTCTECQDIIWANQMYFTYMLGGQTKRIHRDCMLKILRERINEPEF